MGITRAQRRGHRCFRNSRPPSSSSWRRRYVGTVFSRPSLHAEKNKPQHATQRATRLLQQRRAHRVIVTRLTKVKLTDNLKATPHQCFVVHFSERPLLLPIVYGLTLDIRNAPSRSAAMFCGLGNTKEEQTWMHLFGAVRRQRRRRKCALATTPDHSENKSFYFIEMKSTTVSVIYISRAHEQKAMKRSNFRTRRTAHCEQWENYTEEPHHILLMASNCFCFWEPTTENQSVCIHWQHSEQGNNSTSSSTSKVSSGFEACLSRIWCYVQ